MRVPLTLSNLGCGRAWPSAHAPLVPVRHQPSHRLTATQARSTDQMLHVAGEVSPRIKTESVFELAQDIGSFEGEDAAKLRRIFRVTAGNALCSVGPQLAAKYSMDQDNRQLVVSLTNLWTLEQAWFNQVRSLKPQTFTAGSRPVDPTGGGGVGRCDFCDWNNLTATDPWGRVEAQHAVTASNLFKYGEPFHGLALLKSHDPLDFTLDQLSDLMKVSAGWFNAAHDHHHHNASAAPPAGPLHAFFLWNALARAGASQYHAHAQLMATSVPVPAQAQLDLQARLYATQFPGSDYVCDLLAAHRAAGLLRACAATPQDAALWPGASAPGQEAGSSHGHTATGARPSSRAWVAASLSPIKDMEVLVAVELQAQGGEGAQRCGLEDPAFSRALHATLRAMIDTMGVESFNVGILNVPCTGASRGVVGNGAETTSGLPRLLLARVVSRGRMSQPASDFGCLEVIGGASIGHTDPYRMIAAVEQQLGDCMINEYLPM